MSGLRSRVPTVLAIALGGTCVTAVAFTTHNAARAQTSIDVLHSVILIDDHISPNVRPNDGMSALTIHNIESGARIFRGKTYSALGRMSASPDMSFVTAGTGYNCGFHFGEEQINGFNSCSPFAIVAELNSTGPELFQEGRVRGRDFATYGAVAAMRDGSFLFARAGYALHDIGLVMLPQPPFGIDRVHFRRNVGTRAGIDTVSASPRTDHLAVEILPTGRGDEVIIMTDGGTIEAMDVSTWSVLAEPIPFPTAVSPPHYYFGQGRSLPALHATMNTHRGLVVTNRQFAGNIAAIDVVSRTSQSVALAPDLKYVGGVSFNNAWLNRNLLAVHANTLVAVYELVAMSNLDAAYDASRPYVAREIARLPIRAPYNSDYPGNRAFTNAPSGPSLSIAWSASGQYLIAAASEENGDGDFAVIEVLDDGRHLELRRMLVASTVRENLPGDIWTANGLLTPPPSPTPTATASPTPTLTATPTPSPLATATPSPFPTATPSSTATPTPLPAPIYLPLALTESCTPSQRHVDIALAIDASSSMTEPTAAGRTKLAAAVDAARTFLGTLRLAQGDQAAIVTFNSDAWLLQPLTDDRAALDAALASITTASLTRLDRAVAVAAEALADPARRRARTPRR